MSEDPQEERRQELKRTLRKARKKIEDLRAEVTFSELIERAESCRAELPDVRAELVRLRSRGYAFRGDLEERLGEVDAELEPAIEQLRQRAEQATSRLQGEARQLTRAAGRITGNVLRNGRKIEALEVSARSFAREVSSVADTLTAIMSPLYQTVETVQSKTKDLHWTLDQFDEASFQMHPEERPVAAAQACWEDAPGGDKPKGLILFTDHRLYFEQKEERVTKRKFVFFTAETESLHTLLLNEPIGHLEDSTDATRGWVMKEQLLTFAWVSAAKAPAKTTFELSSGTAKDWDDLVELLRSADLEAYSAESASERPSGIVGGAPPSGAAHLVRWPEHCSACAAPLTAPVKGQTAIACTYCGTNHAVEFITPEG